MIASIYQGSYYGFIKAVTMDLSRQLLWLQLLGGQGTNPLLAAILPPEVF